MVSLITTVVIVSGWSPHWSFTSSFWLDQVVFATSVVLITAHWCHMEVISTAHMRWSIGPATSPTQGRHAAGARRAISSSAHVSAIMVTSSLVQATTLYNLVVVVIVTTVVVTIVVMMIVKLASGWGSLTRSSHA